MIKPSNMILEEFLTLHGIDLKDSKCPKCSAKALSMIDKCNWGYRKTIGGGMMADAMFEHCDAKFGVSMTTNKKAFEKWSSLCAPFIEQA